MIEARPKWASMGLRTFTEDPRPWVESAERQRGYEALDRLGFTLPDAGPWDDEPDRAEWFDRLTGYPCLAKRNHYGAWLGYVAVPRGHPLHGLGYEELYDRDDLDLAVHGGLTFAGMMLDEGDWWFGFDCHHAWDVTPGMPTLNLPGATYKTLDYVIMEIQDLAMQLAGAKA